METEKELEGYNLFVKRMDHITEKYSTKNAFTYMRNDKSQTHVTFSDVSKFIKVSAEDFARMGLSQGDRVAVICPHSPYAVFTGMALTHYGITIALIDASLPQAEIEKLLAFSDVRAVFTVQKIYDKLNKELVTNIPCYKIYDKLAITPYDENKTICSNLTQTKDPELDVIAILFSSGTTGQMKGIKGTYTSVLLARDVFEKLSGLQDYMTYLLVLPFNHIAGFTGAMTYFLTGCELGFIEEPDASKLGAALKEFQPYYFAMVPKVYEVMQEKITAAIKEKGAGASAFVFGMMKLSGFLRRNFGINIGKKMFKSITATVFGENIFGIGTGASPCKKDTAEFFLNLGLEWSNLYATTETSVPIVATGVFDRYPNNTVGNVNAHPEINVRINNANADGIGEIAVNSQLMMKGYFRRDDLTAAAFDNDGYFLTGDYGYIDKKGYLHITGRVKDSIVLKNGKKVSPDDVDSYYMSLIPEIKIASRGFENETEMCDEIHIFVEADGLTNIELSDITEKLNSESRKAPPMYKISEIHYIEKIPKTSVGKVKRYMLTLDNISKGSKESQFDSPDDLKGKILNILRSHTDSAEINPNYRLSDDLGFDSLTIFEVTSEIESIISVDISSRINSETTVEKLIDISCNTVDVKIEDYPKPKTPQMVKALKKWIRFSKKHYIIEAEGIENIPKDEGYIICSNHASYFDPIWILTAMGNKADLNGICCMAAVHTMKGRTSRIIFDALGGIPVDREGNTIPAMSYAKSCLTKGRSVIIFPEGARSRDGSMLPFKNGATELALALGRQILPVRIEGAFEIFPRTMKRPKLYDNENHKRYSLKISFGKPINPSGSASELTELLKQKIAHPDITSAITKDKVKALVIHAISEVSQIDDGFTITDNMSLRNDIGMDSLSIFELSVALENEFSVQIEAEINESTTVGDIISMIEKGESYSESNDAGDYPLPKSEAEKSLFGKFIDKTDKRYNVVLNGIDNVVHSENYIFCPNHESHYDGMWVIGHLGSEYRDNICSIAADYLFKKRIYKRGIVLMGGIPTHRSGNTTTAMKRAYECLKNGMNLLIHPEGTRTRNGELGEFKLGAAELSIQTGVKIIPVCINGAREIFPPDKLLPNTGKKYTLEINYGKPISPAGKSAKEITEEIKAFIVSNKRKV